MRKRTANVFLWLSLNYRRVGGRKKNVILSGCVISKFVDGKCFTIPRYYLLSFEIVIGIIIYQYFYRHTNAVPHYKILSFIVIYFWFGIGVIFFFCLRTITQAINIVHPNCCTKYNTYRIDPPHGVFTFFLKATCSMFRTRVQLTRRTKQARAIIPRA